MNHVTSLVGANHLHVLIACAVLAGIAACFRAPWRQLLAHSSRQHMFMVSVLSLMLLWLGGVEVREGIAVHLLGLTPLVLIFGWELALLIGYVAAFMLVVLGFWQWASLPLELVLSVLVPVGVTRLILWFADCLTRTNLFVYLLGVGFLGGVLSLLTSLLLGSYLQGWELEHPVALLLSFPEGFISGTVVTALTVFYPSIMRTYDDARYLGD